MERKGLGLQCKPMRGGKGGACAETASRDRALLGGACDPDLRMRVKPDYGAPQIQGRKGAESGPSCRASGSRDMKGTEFLRSRRHFP